MTAHFSSLGDTALLLPASILLVLALAALGQPRLAGAFGLGMAICGAGTLAAKLLFRACGADVTQLDIVSPSGHASFATVFYGTVALMVSAGRPAWQRATIGCGAALLVLGIGASRVAAGWHSISEVVLGFGLGLAAFAAFAILHARIGAPRVPTLPIGIGLLATVVLLGGRHLEFERPIEHAARRLTAFLDVCDASAARSARSDLDHLRR